MIESTGYSELDITENNGYESTVTNKKREGNAYLNQTGKDACEKVEHHLQEAIDKIGEAISQLNKVEGIGETLYINKLNNLIEKYKTVKKAIAVINKA